MKLTQTYLRELIKESLEEADITDLEAVGAEEAYGDNTGEDEHVRGMLADESKKVSRLLSDIAGLQSYFEKQAASSDLLDALNTAYIALQRVEKML